MKLKTEFKNTEPVPEELGRLWSSAPHMKTRSGTMLRQSVLVGKHHTLYQTL